MSLLLRLINDLYIHICLNFGLYILHVLIITGSTQPEVGIYKRKQETKTRPRKRSRRQEKKKKKTRSRPRNRPRKKKKTFFFSWSFLVGFLVEFLFPFINSHLSWLNKRNASLNCIPRKTAMHNYIHSTLLLCISFETI